MLILGITGGHIYLSEDMQDSNSLFSHDSSAVLIKDGSVIAGIEEERLNRVKHSNKHPVSAIQFVLDHGGYTLNDIDLVCFFSENNLHENLDKRIALKQRREHLPYKQRLNNILFNATGVAYDENKIACIEHQHAHALGSYFQSGFEDSLIVSFDAIGDAHSGIILYTDGKQIDLIEQIPLSQSLGVFYVHLIEHLGYTMFDEYKVMGMAPYGNPDTFKAEFNQLYRLLPEGQFELYPEKINILASLLGPRKDTLTQRQQDFALSIQLLLEDIILHVVSYHQGKTQAKNLCLSGGVSFNCSSNGNLLKSKLFENIFVHPASNDAGGGLGAALCAYYLGQHFTETKQKQYKIEPSRKRVKLNNVYWGPHIGSNDDIQTRLNEWQELIEFEKIEDITQHTAKLLANDMVIGWVQGRSEFGPRALGNRSILADPRPAKNKHRINEMVKLREGYRPFAPSILKEYVSEYYQTPTGQDEFPYMTFILNTQTDKIEQLGAVSHVDGTARVQTVSAETNPRYWELINEFRKITETPILLNTSFNNNVEPIIDSIDDAITCYLTTQLNYLVIGDYLIKKKDIIGNIGNMRLSKLCYTVLEQRNEQHYIYFNTHYTKKQPISATLFKWMCNINSEATIIEQLQEQFDEETRLSLMTEIITLWNGRLIAILP